MKHMCKHTPLFNKHCYCLQFNHLCHYKMVNLFPQAKALEELDAEFGVGDLVEDEMRNERREAYSAQDLRGLRVEHEVVSFH